MERAVGTRQRGLRWPTVSLHAHGYTKKKGECREGLGVRSCLGHSGRQEEKWNLSCLQGHLFLTAAPVSAMSPPTPTFLMQRKKWRVRKVLEMLNTYIHLGLLLAMAIVHHLRSSTGPEANFQILLTYATAGLQPHAFSLIRKLWSASQRTVFFKPLQEYFSHLIESSLTFTKVN